MSARRVVGWTPAVVLALFVTIAGHRAAAEVIQAEQVADTTTSIPDGTGNFTGFGAPSLSDAGTAFYGEGSGGQQGVYVASRPPVVANPWRTDTLADTFADPLADTSRVLCRARRDADHCRTGHPFAPRGHD